MRYMNNRKQKNKRGKNPRQYYIQHISSGFNRKGEPVPPKRILHLTSNQ